MRSHLHEVVAQWLETGALAGRRTGLVTIQGDGSQVWR
jgi:hypothetical protein